ncbi:hypothetical protein [Desulfosudis oleivorans]|uniref:hypothetical protein n=1 Tax=Desulfosudis oleivorans TaxID=181663 RepID=UPI00059E654D|nr:hypothetical protein [Desulfosudis oleivorans]
MILKRTLIFLLILYNICTFVTAFAADASSLIAGEFDATSKNERQKIAKDIIGQIEKLSSYLSTPKPSEIKWVNNERVAIDKLKGTDAWTERIQKLYESPEFQQQKLKSHLDNIIDSLQCVTNENVNLKSEILCWAVASHHLSDETTLNDSIMILKRSGLLPEDIVKKADITESLGYGAKYNWFARGINEYIIIPYLSGRINE